MAASTKKIETIVRSVLESRFGDVDIDSVIVEPDVDEDGEDILRVKVVLGGRFKQLDPEKSSSIIRHLRPKIAEIGEYAFPIISFISKSELGNSKPEAA